MKSQDEVLNILDHNWLTVYDCCEPADYESINEKEEELKGRDDYHDNIK